MIDISFIIPAYDEGKKILNDIILADQFLASNSYSGEIIVVDDGSSDNTLHIAEKSKEEIKTELIVLSNEINKGKGYSIKKGVLRSKGRYIIYFDAGATIPLSDALKGIELIKSCKCDLAFGSRKLPDSIIIKRQKLDRKIASFLFLRFCKFFFNIGNYFTDTQCGFKVLAGEIARTLFNDITLDGFLFEIELIILAERDNYIIREFPVTWKCDRDSRINFVKTPSKIISEINQLRKRKF
ncbi:MAG: glycosyltransferase [Ignavibacteriaceae bacterium]|jgi:dolichyl-phosphate beta-glucosyltransferase|nr:glycosyltransferase [Ignavibacteriaceae bacterium]